MARPTAGRLLAEGWLVALGPLHVGAAEAGSDSDLPLARDGQGRLYLPGTSLAGAFRAWTRQAADPATVEAAWGFQRPNPADSGRTTEAAASRIVVDDAVVELRSGLAEELRDGVGIDRKLGAAAMAVKYDRAVLPAGTRARLSLQAELPPDPGQAKAIRALVADLLAGLQAGELRLGAARTRGLGQVRLDELACWEQDLATFDGILAAIDGIRTSVPAPVAAKPSRRARTAPLAIEAAWHPAGPVLVRDPADGFAAQILPLVTATGPDQLALLLPGSAIKGVLRSQAERIVRTVLQLDPPTEDEPRRRFLRQVEVRLVDWLFGAAATRHAAGPSGSSGDGAGRALRGRGALTVADSVGTIALNPSRWRQVRAAADDQALNQALQEAGLGGWSNSYHVAVDRWTGGAAAHLLYSVLEPHGVSWTPLRLWVDPARFPNPATAQAALGLLLLVLGDLAGGWLPLGFGGNRGLGAVAVDELRLTLPDPAAFGLPGAAETPLVVGLPGGSLERLPAELRQRLEAAWTAWIDSESHAAADRPAPPQPRTPAPVQQEDR
jgi:CRISPR/Cas system CSM-associated protein Csm3 (group 7 of RAMP superfamily)